MASEATHLVVTTEDGSTPVIVLVGELDPATAPTLDDAVEKALTNGATGLTIDMGGLTFVDSSGLRSLISAHKRLAPEPLRLRNPGSFALQLLAITGLDDQFEIETGTA
jgi:anti-anti-sigma factor